MSISPPSAIGWTNRKYARNGSANSPTVPYIPTTNRERNVDFIYLDNFTDVGCDDGQRKWFEGVLDVDKQDSAIKAIVVGMHRAIPIGGEPVGLLPRLRPSYTLNVCALWPGTEPRRAGLLTCHHSGDYFYDDDRHTCPCGQRN